MRRSRLALSLMLGVAAGVACNPTPPPGQAPDYVPSMAFAYDGRYLDGSFEDAQGSGWDTCASRTAGTTRMMDAGGSNGSRFLVFESAECSGGCSATNPSLSQAFLWFSNPTNTSDPMGLYFDVVNMSTADPSGLLSIYGTDGVCEKETLMASISLDELALSPDWGTRCVDVSATGAHAAIGLAVTGGSHRVGIDALRLGPPCHGQ